MLLEADALSGRGKTLLLECGMQTGPFAICSGGAHALWSEDARAHLMREEIRELLAGK